MEAGVEFPLDTDVVVLLLPQHQRLILGDELIQGTHTAATAWGGEGGRGGLYCLNVEQNFP